MASRTVSILDLREHLRSHMETEGSILGEYVEAANGTESKALRYLVDLIVKDERRHHQLFRDMVETLDREIDLVRPGAVVPSLDFDRVEGDHVYEVIDRLLHFEMEDKRELKEMRRQLRDSRDASLFGLLVELMQRDTDKHIAVLRFAKKHTKRRGASRRREPASLAG